MDKLKAIVAELGEVKKQMQYDLLSEKDKIFLDSICEDKVNDEIERRREEEAFQAWQEGREY